MKVLVTGAGGMVGSHMVELLYNRGDDVIGIWHKNKKNIEQVTLPIKFVQCDLRYAQGIDEIIMDFLPDQIFHLAAQSYPTVSWVSPTETIDVNINSTVNIYEAIKKARKYIKPDYDPMVVIESVGRCRRSICEGNSTATATSPIWSKQSWSRLNFLPVFYERPHSLYSSKNF